MHTIGSFEAKTHFAALLKAVEKGEEVIITKHGPVVAKLIPVKMTTQTQAKETIARIKTLSRNITLDGIDWKILRYEEPIPYMTQLI